MRLHTIKPAKGSTHRKKIVGRGRASGHGKTSTRGHKGQKARSGSAIRPGFEGGQMPMHRRLPKRGFTNAEFKTTYQVFNLDRLDEKFEDGALINEASLREKNLLKGRWRRAWDGIKILGDGDVKKKWTFEVDKVSESARKKIEAAGGSITIIYRTLLDKTRADRAAELVRISAEWSAKQPAATA
jgi:large subunit ribosomal protein L15